MPTVVCTPPHSTEAEQATLGGLLIDPDSDIAMDVFSKLQADHFFDPAHREIFVVLQKLHRKNQAIDLLTVTTKLADSNRINAAGGSAYIAELTTAVPTAANMDHYAEIVLEKSRRRSIAQMAQNILRYSMDDSKTADELTALAEQEVMQLSGNNTQQWLTHLGEMNTERFERYIALYETDDKSKLTGLSTGFPGIDAKLNGLQEEDFTVIAGRPGMGKTALALDIAMHVATQQRKSVGIFSLEMSKEQLFGRLFAKQLGIESWKLEKGVFDEKQLDQMGPVLDQFADIPLYFDDSAGSSISHIRSRARRHQMRHGLDLVIVDYMQLIQVTDRAVGENQTQRITHISQSLKQLARDLRCPVIALSQLSRNCEQRPDKRPQTSDLRDSGAIEQDANHILMLYRESEYNEDCDDPDCTDVLIRKNRNGPKGSVELTFDKKTMTFHSRESD